MRRMAVFCESGKRERVKQCLADLGMEREDTMERITEAIVVGDIREEWKMKLLSLHACGVPIMRMDAEHLVAYAPTAECGGYYLE